MDETKTPYVLATVRLTGKAVNLESAAAKLRISLDAIDRDYGLVAVDRAQHLYAVLCHSHAFENEKTPRSNLFSDPRIGSAYSKK